MQAAALDPQGRGLWTVEHGARGGDELNNPQPGRNHGWHGHHYGVDYSGAKIGEGTAKEGMEQPVYYWDPVIAPSGATFYTGDAFPDWKGDLFVGSLNPGALVRLKLNGGRVRCKNVTFQNSDAFATSSKVLTACFTYSPTTRMVRL